MLRCFQHLSPAQRGYPTMPKNWTIGTPEVGPFRSSRTRKDAPQVSTPATDRVQPVLRRFEPSSRTFFIGEQPNPWEVLPPQDKMSRHRCRSGSYDVKNYKHTGTYIVSLLPKSIDYAFILLRALEFVRNS